MNPNFRNFALWVVIFLLVLALVTLFQSPNQGQQGQEIAYSQLLTDAEAGRIGSVVIAGDEITGRYQDGAAFRTFAPNDPNLVQTLQERGVQINAEPPQDNTPWFVALFLNWLPILIFIAA